jgi:DNA modification methylase
LLKSWNNDANNLKEMLKSEQPSADAEPQTDRAAELLEKWGVKPGDLWQIGEHRLICGDCTDAATVAQVMDGERAELAPVDPPYNVGFEYDGETVDDQKQAEEYEKFTKAWFALCQSVSDRQIVTPGCNNLALWMRWFDAFHWAPWVKRNTQTHGRVTHFWAWEPVLFFGNKWVRRRQLDIYDFPAQFNTQKETANHPCPKPLAMWEDLLKSHSEEGAIILESFSGSGTTLVACENLGRKCRAIEISPAYVAVALERMSTAFPALEIRRVE